MQTHLAADQRPGAYADIKDTREQRHGDVGGIRSGGQHFHLHAETDNHDRHPPEDAEQHQVLRVMRGRQQQQQAGEQQGNRQAYQPRRVLVTELTEQNAADNTGPAKDQQQYGGKVAAQARYRLDKGLDIAVGYNERSPPPRSECTR